jgi:spoIIIJ-associated protein
MRAVETEGATIDEAIERALETLALDRDKVEIEIIENATRGMLGFGGKPARVRATVRAALAPAEGAQVSPETPSPDTSAALEAAEMVLEEILAQLGVEDPVDVSTADDGSHRLSIAGDGAGIVIGRHGQTLDAIDYLVNRVASHKAGTLVRVVVDVEGYRERRQEALEVSARRAAQTVRETGRSMMLDPMSPRDRRIVHLALTGEAGVTTRSQGEGSYRRVVIAPAGSDRERS